MPNSEVAPRFWADTRVRTLNYDRGMLYLAGVDRELRKRSNNQASLDDVMFDLIRLNRTGHTINLADWESQLRKRLGAAAVRTFHAFLDGKLDMPPSDTFGPCFRRTTVRLRRYDLGFDPAVLAEPTRIVRGLRANSAAAAAGLRDGDEIVRPEPQDQIQGDQTAMLDLRIRRSGQERTIVYLPRGEAVDAVQWERVAEVSDAQCAL